MKNFFTMVILAVSLLTFSMGASAQPFNDLNSSKALTLAQSAQQHYWSTMKGFVHKNCTLKSFNYKGTDYRYFCSELNTKNKLVKYLNEVFTLNAIDKGIKKYRYIEYKDKLAQPNGDFGSLRQWDKAKAKLIYQRKDIRLYDFSVPYGQKGKFEKIKVTFVKVGNRWEINSFDAVK